MIPAGAGSSGTPLARKLGIKEESVVAVAGGPDDFLAALEPVPAGVVLRRRVQGRLDVVVFFTKTRSRLERQVTGLSRAIFPDGGLWVAWPKRASGVRTDMTEDVVRDVCLPLGLVDNKVAAIDATWSGLRMVWRRELRG